MSKTPVLSAIQLKLYIPHMEILQQLHPLHKKAEMLIIHPFKVKHKMIAFSMLHFLKNLKENLMLFNIVLAASMFMTTSSCSSSDAERNLSANDKNLENFDLHGLTCKIKELNEKIDTLEAKLDKNENNRFIDNLNFVELKELHEIQDDFFKHKKEINKEISKIKTELIKSTITFNLKEKQGFSKINVNGHIFCVSVDDVHPYLDGFKVVFNIGNPFYATFKNPKINLKWNKDLWKYYQEQEKLNKDVSGIFDSWDKSYKKNERVVLKELKPGVWNKVELLLTPATLNEIEHVEFSMDVDTVSFYQDTNF